MTEMIAHVEYTSKMIDVRDESTNYLIGKLFEVDYFGLTRTKFSIYFTKDNFDSIDIKLYGSKDILQILSTNCENKLDDIFDELCSHRMILIIIDMILSTMYSKGDLSEYIKMIDDELSERGYDSFEIYDEFV